MMGENAKMRKREHWGDRETVKKRTMRVEVDVEVDVAMQKHRTNGKLRHAPE